MKCPFLKEATVRFCRISSIQIMLPRDSIHDVDQKCSSPDYVNCPQAKEGLRSQSGKIQSRCPFLQESLVLCCKAAAATKPIPYNDSLFSRCNSNAHRHCPLYLQRAHPRRAKDSDDSSDDRGRNGSRDSVSGIPVPKRLTYSRNHMWLDVGEDGSCDVGVDAFLTHVLGEIDSISFISGKRRQEPAAVLTVRGVDLSLTFPSPINVGGSNALLRTSPETLVDDPYGAGWLFEGTRPDWGNGRSAPDQNPNLVPGEKAPSWMQEEMDRISGFVHTIHSRRYPEYGNLMLDGGILSGNLTRHLNREEMLFLFKCFFTWQEG